MNPLKYTKVFFQVLSVPVEEHATIRDNGSSVDRYLFDSAFKMKFLNIGRLPDF